jgi:DNA-directed RNA polymerase beta subunit
MPSKKQTQTQINNINSSSMGQVEIAPTEMNTTTTGVTTESKPKRKRATKASSVKSTASEVSQLLFQDKSAANSSTEDKPVDIRELLRQAGELPTEVNHEDPSVKPLLEHLGDYIHQPFDVLESYFSGKPLERLARHQTESYNNFVNYQMQRTIEMFNPITIKSVNDYDEATDTFGLIVKINLKNLRFHHPQIHENNGATKTMMPQEARLRNFTYSSNSIVDLNIEYTVRNEDGEERKIEKTLNNIKLCSLPVMLKSSICILSQYKHVSNVLTGECDMDCGGYFIIKGSEKTVLCQERAAENRIYVFNGKNTPKWDWVAEFKSVPDNKCISPKQVELMVSSKTNIYGHGIYVLIPRLKQKRYIELFVLFRALGVLSDKKICEYILLNTEDKQNAEMLSYLEASMEDAKPFLNDPECIQQDAFDHIVSMVAYNPYQVEKGPQPIKKHDYTKEIFQNDFFPHCKSPEQKLYLLGFMANRLIRTALGYNPPDDRDSYLNKRIELCGSLLNNLFRNHYIRFVKDIEKQVVREINLGAWKSNEDYENIINMTNIYKIIKPTTIENGMNRALSTGDFSVRQSNSSSKVGVAQVLNRLTYLGTLSHLRRVNTPLEKNGELVAPRKLHNTTWGFLCPVESPEGQSVGIVKNISFMTHMTIPTNSHNLYDIVEDYILKVEDVSSPLDLHDEVKVFINGTWVGIAKDPLTMYKDLKTKKHKGLINIYTSIVFDYARMIIRICNDGGRMTRPVFKVQNNAVLITKEIISKLKTKELVWNDLLTDCRIEESVIEYIDPEEQNHSMIAMKFRGDYINSLKNHSYINYDYCEIHPCTLLGVLASCVPFPDCNQAPRNTYQCLDPNEFVYMSDGSKKRIGDVKVGDCVVTFHPKTFEQSHTKVINQFVRQNEYPIYKITTESGKEITATGDHKFMTNIGWATVDQIIQNSDIRIGVNTSDYSINSEYINEKLLILTEKKFLNTMLPFEIYETKNRKINKISKYVNTLKTMGLLDLYNNNKLLPILARISGFLYADGSLNVYSKKGAGNRIYKNFQCAFDFGTLADATHFQHDMERLGFSKRKILDGTRSFANKKDNRIQTHHTFTCIYNGVFPAFLIALGISYGKKTENSKKKIPDWIMNSDECSRQFMKGFQGGDGSKISWHKTIDKRNKSGSPYYLIRTAETSKQINKKYEDSLMGFMRQCVEILKRFKVKVTNDVCVKNISEYRVKVSFTISSNAQNLIHYYDNVGYAYAQTKNDASFQIVEYLKYRLLNKDKSYNIEKWLLDKTLMKPSVMFTPVSSIEKCSDGFISDIEVESNNHSFISTNGILSSNCAMAKQAIGISATNYDKRMDKTTYALNNPSRPLVDTRIMDFLQLNRIPSGNQIHVAIMSFTGYNQEDSVLINKSAIDRGLFAATIYHTEKDEDKNVIRDEIIRCKPDPSKTKSIKHGNYDKINQHGFINENTEVKNRDIIISKVVPIKENRNDPTKVIKYEDQSKSFRTTEETYIDKNYTGRNGEGCNFAKTRVRIYRKPVIGDKFCIKETAFIMTNKGWIMFKDIDLSIHKVATLKDGKILDYVTPERKYEYDCNQEELYAVVNKHVRMVCTMNHKVYVKKRKSKNYGFIEAKNVMGKQVAYKKNAINPQNGLALIHCGETAYAPNPLLQLLGCYIRGGSYETDGSVKRLCFSRHISNEYEFKVTSALMALEVNYYNTDEHVMVGGKNCRDLVFYLSNIRFQTLPMEVWQLSQDQCRLLLDSIIDTRTNTYINSSRRFTEDIQRLCLHAGWSATLQYITRSKLIEVQIEKHRNEPKVNDRNFFGCRKYCKEGTVEYTGKVGCIEVPETHLFYYKDSIDTPPVWTGNSSRHGQKGTVGNILPEADMPFSKDGLKPDLIINPHAIPSRMTIAHLKETLLGKVLVELGMFGDGTSFGNLDVYSITEELQRCGYESYGNEVLYSGQNGRQMETSIFIGPVFYQRLKHMVNDKEHSRAIGPVVNLTRQPAEGRSRDGGFRIGEMERDVMIAHGMSKFCRERMYDVADKYALHVCKKCGMIATFNNGDRGVMRSKQGFTVHRCNTCDNVTDFSYVEVPYAFKLMSQELQTINVVPRLITT